MNQILPFRLLILVSLLFCLAVVQTALAQSEVQYNRDVRSILSANCFECHGPDEDTREADLRLDQREAAVADLGGYRAVVPGNAEQSELLSRLISDDPDLRMPPPDSNKTLSKEQIATLKQWIDDGATYERHWSFVPPERPNRPDVSSFQDAPWARNEIDNFVLARLQAEGLRPSPEADPYTLVRRLYLDLIGLPPTPAEADAFVNDRDPRAYERLVDQLLQSPHYGERWARVWLDLARYADTNGYEKDRARSIWPYRDWVVKALNAGMPFDQFTVEQLAGDMLPEATLDQRIATGFHRNTMLNEEGGIDPLEYRYHAMVDRVATTGTVWMGLTIGCVQCHTHKYDPIVHTDYYRLMALLNNADEPDVIVPDPSVANQREVLLAQIASLESRLEGQFPPLSGAASEQERRQQHFQKQFSLWLNRTQSQLAHWQVVRPVDMKSNLPRLEVLSDGAIFSTGDITKRDLFQLKFDVPATNAPMSAVRLEVLPDDRLPAGGPGRAFYEGRKGDFFLSELSAAVGGEPVQFRDLSSSFGKISVGSGTPDAANVIDKNGDTGWSTATREGERHTLVLLLEKPLPTPASLDVSMLFERHFAASLGRFRFSVTTKAGPVKALDLPHELEPILLRDPDSWTEAERTAARLQFARTAPELAEARKPIDKLRSQLPAETTSMVFQERPADNPRVTHRHHRGEYLQTREEVAPGVPAVFPAIPEDVAANRLSFARWLVSDKNPLVARVVVNRAWQAFFGRGIVATSEDFGTQGELPSHPDLLDWLAVEVVDQGWSLKKLHRQIVTSATYRQSSQVSADLLVRDPSNILLARGPRFRANAETVRDIGLVASGLFAPKVGGPSVYPPQPASVTALAYGKTAWKPSAGKDRYRRSLYTFSKRTAPFAAYTVFDAPTGETCLPRRERSNTALQALTMLNDPMFLEMAEALAANAIEASSTPAERATHILRRCLTRPPTDNELTALTTFAADQKQRFEARELDASKVCTTHTPSPELAAWTMVARAALNLDETITKP